MKNELAQYLNDEATKLKQQQRAERLAVVVGNDITATANDINAYLGGDVPLECYQRDIDRKLTAMRERLEKAIKGDYVDLFPVGTAVNVKSHNDAFNDFKGIVKSHNKGFIQVEDGDTGEVWDTSAYQLTFNTDVIMHD